MTKPVLGIVRNYSDSLVQIGEVGNLCVKPAEADAHQGMLGDHADGRRAVTVPDPQLIPRQPHALRRQIGQEHVNPSRHDAVRRGAEQHDRKKQCRNGATRNHRLSPCRGE